MSLREPTQILRIHVFHRMRGGSGSNSAFENASNHPEAIVEAMRWLGVLAEAHECTDMALDAFSAGVVARKRCEESLGLTPGAANTQALASGNGEVGGVEPVELALLQARYVLRDLHSKHPECGYDKLARACEIAAAPPSGEA